LRRRARQDSAGAIIQRGRDRPVYRARLRSPRGRAASGPTACRCRGLASGAPTLFTYRGAAGTGARAPVRAGRRRFRRRHRVGDDRAVALRLDAAVAARRPALTRTRQTVELPPVGGVYRMAYRPHTRPPEEHRMRVAFPSIVVIPLL